VLPGATGTLAELATVWELVCKGLMPRRPIVCVGSFWRPLIGMMSSARPASAEFVAMIDAPGGLREHFPAAALP
jgi:predicted Rossmann-fold nucleotide-binding protein